MVKLCTNSEIPRNYLRGIFYGIEARGADVSGATLGL